MNRPHRVLRTVIILSLAIWAMLIVTSFRAEMTSAQWTDQATATTGSFSVATAATSTPLDNLKCQDSETAMVIFRWEQRNTPRQLLAYTLQIQREISNNTWLDEGAPHAIAATNQKDVSVTIKVANAPMPGKYRAVVTAHPPSAPGWASGNTTVGLEYKIDGVKRIWDC